jgi:abortive infection bacteriophage resistance protein
MSVKPFKNYDEQIALLEARGLEVPDHNLAREFLKHHNYYRLSAYRFPFQTARDQFETATSFDDLCALYRFDHGLRLLVGEACKCLEISVRARWAYVLGEKHGELAYEDPAVFRDARLHTQHLASLDREITRSHEVFISHYQNTHQMPRPPIWAACEVMSFGLLSRFYTNIKQSSTRKKIAKTYGFGVSNLASLLLHASYLRNLCAHHSRIWNRAFTITVSLPTSQPNEVVAALNHNPQAERKIYNSLVLLAHITDTVSATSDWKGRLKTHLLTLNRPNHSEMGFPAGWEQLDFWN